MTSLGVGVYVLSVIWFITFMLCWVSVRTGHVIGKVSLIMAVVITIILLMLPKGDAGNLQAANFYDTIFVPHYSILSLLVISLLASSVFTFIYVCLTPKESQKITSFGSLN